MNTVTNVRYASLSDYPQGGILFDYAGQTIRLKETDATVCLVGNPQAAKIIARDYGYLLQVL